MEYIPGYPVPAGGLYRELNVFGSPTGSRWCSAPGFVDFH